MKVGMGEEDLVHELLEFVAAEVADFGKWRELGHGWGGSARSGQGTASPAPLSAGADIAPARLDQLCDMGRYYCVWPAQAMGKQWDSHEIRRARAFGAGCARGRAHSAKAICDRLSQESFLPPWKSRGMARFSVCFGLGRVPLGSPA
ncbi:MAG: hypothetical protein NT154_09710 [Verrucomicrobia bacterium]|nr:hypothetical protein [Verrucomicrobiota bacterium]